MTMNDKNIGSEGPDFPPEEPPDIELPEPRNGHRRDLIRGVAIFFALNALMFAVNQIFAKSGFGIYIGWIAMIVNLVVVVYYGKYRRSEAGGVLGAFTFLLVLTFILAPICWFSVCFYNVMENWH
jgi:FtsH-binding integral membrane protein